MRFISLLTGCFPMCVSVCGAPLSVVQNDGDPAILNMGTLLEGERVDFLVNLTTAETGDVEIVERFVGPCGCTMVDSSPVVIESGKKAQLSGHYVATSVRAHSHFSLGYLL